MSATATAPADGQLAYYDRERKAQAIAAYWQYIADCVAGKPIDRDEALQKCEAAGKNAIEFDRDREIEKTRHKKRAAVAAGADLRRRLDARKAAHAEANATEQQRRNDADQKAAASWQEIQQLEREYSRIEAAREWLVANSPAAIVAEQQSLFMARKALLRRIDHLNETIRNHTAGQSAIKRNLELASSAAQRLRTDRTANELATWKRNLAASEAQGEQFAATLAALKSELAGINEQIEKLEQKKISG